MARSLPHQKNNALYSPTQPNPGFRSRRGRRSSSPEQWLVDEDPASYTPSRTSWRPIRAAGPTQSYLGSKNWTMTEIKTRRRPSSWFEGFRYLRCLRRKAIWKKGPNEEEPARSTVKERTRSGGQGVLLARASYAGCVCLGVKEEGSVLLYSGGCGSFILRRYLCKSRILINRLNFG